MFKYLSIVIFLSITFLYSQNIPNLDNYSESEINAVLKANPKLKDKFENSQASNTQFENNDIIVDTTSTNILSKNKRNFLPDKPKEIKRNKNTEIQKYFGYSLFIGNENKFHNYYAESAPEDYLLGPGDKLTITLWGDTELRYINQISTEGTIFIKNIGLVNVNGLTLLTVQDKLKKILSKSYNTLNPSNGHASTFLDVSLGKINPVSVYVTGNVANPGIYMVSSYASVLELLYKAGGVKKSGSLRNINILRKNNKINTLDVYNFLTKGKIKQLKFKNKDVVYVPMRGKSINLKGEVKKAYIYELKKDETLADLIKYSGGLPSSAEINQVLIKRIVPIKNRRDNKYNYKVFSAKLLNGNLAINPVELFDNDTVVISKSYNELDAFVKISGAVFMPGIYAYEKYMTLKDLFSKAKGLRADAYKYQIDLVSTSRTGMQKFKSINLLNTKNLNISLTNLDSIKIYSLQEWNKDKFVSINGHIKNPGRYKFYKGMKISDLIRLAGSLNDSLFYKQTYLKEASLIRYTDDYLKSYIIKVDLEKILNGETSADIELKRDDKFLIRKHPDYEERKVVKIMGEVKFPGVYVLTNKKNTFGYLLKQAGGFTEDVFPKGLKYFRKNGKIIIDMSDKKSFTIFQIEDGDSIFIPRRPGIVRVEGFVNNPGMLKLNADWDIDDYIEAAGDIKISNDEELSNIMVYYPSGNAKREHWYSSPDITEGCRIVLYSRKVDADRVNWTEIIRDWAAITSAVATTVLILSK